MTAETIPSMSVDSSPVAQSAMMSSHVLGSELSMWALLVGLFDFGS